MGYKVNSEQIKKNGLEWEYEFSLDRKDFEKDLKERLIRQGRGMRVSGFRSGKIPLALIDQKIGLEERASLANDKISEIFSQIAKKENIFVPEAPRYVLDSPDGLRGSDAITGKITFEIGPEVPDIDMKGFVLEEAALVVDDGDVNKSLENIASQNKISKPLESERKAQEGDTVFYSMEYTLPSGETKTQDGSLVLGASGFPKEFEAAVVGAEKGKSFSEKINVPKYFPDSAVAGKKINFKVTFLDIQETFDSPIDDDLAKKLNFDSLDALKEHLRGEIQKSFSYLLKVRQKFLVREHLVTLADFPVPQELMNRKARKDFVLSLIHAGLDPKALQEMSLDKREEVCQKSFGKAYAVLQKEKEDLSKKYWQIYFICHQVAKKENIEVSHDEIAQEIQRMDKGSRDRDYFSRYFEKNPEEYVALQRNMLIEKVLDFLADGCEKGSQVKSFSIQELRQQKKDYDALY